MEAYEYFVYYLMAPIVFALGLMGNMTALVVFFKGNLKNIGPVLIYRLMFTFDTLFIIQIILFYLQYPFYLDITILSRLSCKLFEYLNYQMDSISSYLLVYISLEKYISINNPSKRRILNSKKNQIIFFISVINVIFLNKFITLQKVN
jgi:growth hormone secretagogue receptor